MNERHILGIEEIEALAIEHLCVGDDDVVFGTEKFARAIERAILAASAGQAEPMYQIKVEGIFGRWDDISKEQHDQSLAHGDPTRVRIVHTTSTSPPESGLVQNESADFEAWVEPRNFTSSSRDAARLGWMARARIAKSAPTPAAAQDKDWPEIMSSVQDAEGRVTSATLQVGEVVTRMVPVEQTAATQDKKRECCPHGIHWDNACGACTPPRGTKVLAPEDERGAFEKAIDKLIYTAWYSGEQDGSEGFKWSEIGDSYNSMLRSRINDDKKALLALIARATAAPESKPDQETSQAERGAAGATPTPEQVCAIGACASLAEVNGNHEIARHVRAFLLEIERGERAGGWK